MTTSPTSLPVLPSALPRLPANAVYLGTGGSFRLIHPQGYFDGWIADEHSTAWSATPRPGGRVATNHYAAPFDSEIVRLNRGLHSGGVRRLTAFREMLPGRTEVRVEVDAGGRASVAIGSKEVITTRRPEDLRGLSEVLLAAAAEMETEEIRESGGHIRESVG